MTSHLAAAVLTAILLFPTRALAGAPESTPATEALRRQVYREGQALGDAGKWDEAAAKFRKVVELRSAPKALIALGLAEEHTGHLLDADTHYRIAREDAVTAGNKADAREAQDSRTALAPRIPRLALSLPADVTGIEINVDAVAVPSRNGEVQVDPGEHTVVISAPKRVAYRVIIKMKEAEHQEFSVALPLKPAWSKPPEPESGTISNAAIAAWFVGGAGMIAGGTLLGLGANRPAQDDPSALIIPGGVALAIGTVVTVLGFVAWRLDASSHSAAASHVQVTVIPGHNSAWIGIQGTY